MTDYDQLLSSDLTVTGEFLTTDLRRYGTPYNLIVDPSPAWKLQSHDSHAGSHMIIAYKSHLVSRGAWLCRRRRSCRFLYGAFSEKYILHLDPITSAGSFYLSSFLAHATVSILSCSNICTLSCTNKLLQCAGFLCYIRDLRELNEGVTRAPSIF